MDYFKQRRAYRQWKQNEGSIARGQNDVYRELLDYANDEGHLDEGFKLRNSALVDWTGLSLQGVIKARNDLANMGLIEYKPGVKNKAVPTYKIKQLYYTKTPQSVHQEYNNQFTKSVTTGSSTVEQLVEHKDLLVPDNDLTKTEGTKYQARGVSHVKSLKAWESLWGFPNGVARQDLFEWCKEFSDDLVAYVIEYAARRDVKSAGAYRYVDTVLSRYREAGIKTVQQAEDDAKQYRQHVATEVNQRKVQKPRYGKQPVVEQKPSWEQEGYKAPSRELTPEEHAAFEAQLASLRKPKETTS